jgi:succinyl-CoA synthetase beta subunit
MVLFEFEGKQLFNRHGLPLLPSLLVENAREAAISVEKFGPDVILKAQIAGGKRGKRGLIKIAHNSSEAIQFAQEIFARTDIPEAPITRILIEPAIPIAEEWYLAVLPDRTTKKLMIMVSNKGGIEIEQVARDFPEAILKIYVRFTERITSESIQTQLRHFKLPEKRMAQLVEIIEKLVLCARQEDLLLAEINPLIWTPSEDLWVLDAKVQIDEGAFFRHPDHQAFESFKKTMSPIQENAKKADLAYVGLDGDIGTISCGAGLSMTTCDLLETFGGKAANFLDVGGGASPEKVETALQILFAQSHIRGILVNVFGGITRGEQVAQGIIAALKTHPEHVPIVVRLIGTNDKEGVALLAAAGIDAYTEMEPAIKRILEVLA